MINYNEKFWFLKRGIKYKILDGKIGVKRAYDLMAKNYDTNGYWTRRDEIVEENCIREWVRELSSPILDVGSGTGRYTTKFLREKKRIVSLDLSMQMLKITKEKVKSSKFIEVQGDAEALPFKSNSFNSLICNLAFDHFSNSDIAISEFERVLKKKGKCIISVYNSNTLNRFKRKLKLPCTLVPFKTENSGPILVYEVGHCARELKPMLEKYGFNVDSIKFCSYFWAFPFVGRLFNLIKPLQKFAHIHILKCTKSS